MPPATATVLTLPLEDKTRPSIRAKALLFADPSSQALLAQAERVAPSDAPVLICGETGTGKELLARHLHELSGRRGPFIAVNCGAISETLAESEFFGHEAGAFTGAAGRREGWFEAANGGTLFLDEVGDLPLALQVKLLRVLQEREVVRLGARRPIPLDIRLVSATNVDLAEAVAAGHFRLDLLYRLNIVALRLPPLRERTGDILPLARHFLSHYGQRLGAPRPQLSAAAESILLGYAWPGNIRELENSLHCALLTADHGLIEPRHLSLRGVVAGRAAEPAAVPVGWPGLTEQLAELIASAEPDVHQRVERLLIEQGLSASRGNQVQAAARLGLTRHVLRTLMKRHGLLPSPTVAFHKEPQWNTARLVRPASRSA
ncbi:sigma 54-interacting transcriptional regulator [Neisseriaceae bacterium JH1-16]|nr:sigma 54-interacting transcriptional regulator [Neisseriaceae bacterium JH1-16]